MVNCVGFIRKLYDRIPDWIWPHLTGNQVSCPEDEALLAPRHARHLDDINHNLEFRLSQAEQRIRSVESKLLAMLALASILSLTVTAGLAISISLDTVVEDDKLFAVTSVCLVFYVAVQLLRSLWCVVSGLMRRSYKVLSPQDMIPKNYEDAVTFRSRLLNLQLNNMNWNEWVVDQKVSEMAVAHEALKNVLRATFILILLIFFIAVVNLFSSQANLVLHTCMRFCPPSPA